MAELEMRVFSMSFIYIYFNYPAIIFNMPKSQYDVLQEIAFKMF